MGNYITFIIYYNRLDALMKDRFCISLGEAGCTIIMVEYFYAIGCDIDKIIIYFRDKYSLPEGSHFTIERANYLLNKVK